MPHRSRKTFAAMLAAAASLAFTGLVISAPTGHAATTPTIAQFSPQDDGDDEEDTTCDGVIDWTPEAFYRSGTTVRHGDHLWQTNAWVKGGEEPHVGSSTWTIVADCRPR
ncbi:MULTISPECIES: hypothetical protein [unclassified Streptomyces]|uniref:hypothetical protein n=1 Tax=unclassified Streptomyces TaxID=2593676 RepID=UPI003450E900